MATAAITIFHKAHGMHEHTPEEKTLTHTSGADTAQPHAAAATSDGFSPIPDLFRKSWQMMTDAVLNALLLTITSGVLGFLVLGVALIAIVAVSVTQIDTSSFASKDFSSAALDALSQVTPQFVIMLSGLVVLFSLVMTYIGSACNAAMLLAFARSAEKPRFSSLLKDGFKVAGWLVLYMIITSFLLYGAFWLFLIPMIVMSVLFMFSIYEIVIAKKGPIAALKGSTTLVAENFGPIFVRVIVFFMLNVVITYLIPSFFSAISEEVGAAYSVLNIIISFVLGWFGTAYTVILYREAQAATPAHTTRSGLFMLMVSFAVFGWLLFAAVASFLFTNGPKYLEQWQETRLSNSVSESMLAAETNTVSSSCGLTLGLPLTIEDEEPFRYWIYEERQVLKQSFRGIIPDDEMDGGPMAAVISFKSKQDRFGDSETFNLGFPGYNIFCIDNVNDYTLDEFVAQAQTAEGKTVELDGETELWGGLVVQPTYVSGLNEGDFYKEPLYLGVVPGEESQLLVIIPWGTTQDDAMYKEISEDMRVIKNSLQPVSFDPEAALPDDFEAMLLELDAAAESR